MPYADCRLNFAELFTVNFNRKSRIYDSPETGWIDHTPMFSSMGGEGLFRCSGQVCRQRGGLCLLSHPHASMPSGAFNFPLNWRGCEQYERADSAAMLRVLAC